MKEILKLEWVRYVLVGLIGIAIGAIFYPSKTITTEETSKFEQKIERLENEKKYIQKSYSEQYNKEINSRIRYQKESTQKIDSLKEENYRLKSKVTEKKFKIIRPDGTIEERWFKESETEVVASTVTKIKSEFTRKVKSIENKWKKLHVKRIKKIKEDYEKQIITKLATRSETTKKKKVEINKRHFGISLGITNEKDYFSNVTYDMFGPVFLDILLETSNNFVEKKAGIGVGIRF